MESSQELSTIRFAIITVTFNAADCVEKTIQSVLSQTYPYVDYLIVDGGSKDETVEIVGKYANSLTRWISEPDKGIYDGMNKGIRMVNELVQEDGQERYVLMLNADDTLFSKTTLAELSVWLGEQQQFPDVVCGAWMLHPEHGCYRCEPGNFALLPRKYVICHQATFVKASVLARFPFDLKYKLAGDYDQLSKLYMSGCSFMACPDIVVSDMILNTGATDRHWRQSVHEGFEVVRSHGFYRFGEESWLLLRKATVRLIKKLLPARWSNAFFSWLGKHYKAM